MNTTATLAIPAGLPTAAAAHWLPVHLDLKGESGGRRLDRLLLSDAELGPFAPGARHDGHEGYAGAGPSAANNGSNNDAGGGSDQQQEAQPAPNAAAAAAAAGSAPADAALKATLRGRALAGARWPLPPGVGGLVLEPAPDLNVQEEQGDDEEEMEAGDDDDGCGYGGGGRRRQQQQQQQQPWQAARPAAAPRQRSWRAVAVFGELVAWNHDVAPAPTDAAWRVMDFLAVSAAAHGLGAGDGGGSGGGIGGGGGGGGAGGLPPPITAADVDAEVRAAAAGGARPPDAVRARPGRVE